jgi:hypothetical protein
MIFVASFYFIANKENFIKYFFLAFLLSVRKELAEFYLNQILTLIFINELSDMSKII